MSRYDEYRSRMNLTKSLEETSRTAFIENSVSSTEVLLKRTGETQKAVLTNMYKEGADETILFTYNLTDAAKNATVGDYIEEKGTTFLLYKEYRHPFREQYLKHRAIECNTKIKKDDIVQDAYYLSSLRRLEDSDVTLVGNSGILDDKDNALLITAYNENLKHQDRIMISNEAFRIQSIDDISQSGIMYISIKTTQINLSLDDIEEGIAISQPAPEDSLGANELRAGSSHTLSTNFGFISFNASVKIISKTLTSCTFEVPYDVEDLVVKTKNTNGDLITNNYKVVI